MNVILLSVRVMETPKSGSSRHTSRLKRTRSTISRVEAAVASKSKSAPCRTSTPSSKELPTSKTAPDAAAKEDSHDEDDDDYLLYPGTQYEDGIPEIIWVDEASPRTTRAMLRKRTDDAWLAAGGSSDELTPKPRPEPAVTKIVPLPQLPTMCRRQLSEVQKENARKGRKAIEELEQIYNKMLEEEAAAAAAAANTQSGQHEASSLANQGVETNRSDNNVEDTDAFCDSGDDSFLCRASQIVDRGPVIIPKNGQRAEMSKIKFPPAIATMPTPAVMQEVKEDEEDPFADDMDSLLSQIDVSTVPRAQEKNAILRPQQSGSKMLLQTPSQQESGVKRRCNSAEAGTGTPPLGWKGTASMPRCATSPDSHRPPGLPGGRPLARCTQEEIGEVLAFKYGNTWVRARNSPLSE